MDNATLSLLNSPIFWTFFVLGILSLLGSMLVSYPSKRYRYGSPEREDAANYVFNKHRAALSALADYESKPEVRSLFRSIAASKEFTANAAHKTFARRRYRDEHAEEGGIGA